MSFPITANLDGSLKVDIHLHQIYLGDRDRYCWTYLTRGMEQHQQREMCLSLLVDDEGDTEDFPKTPIKMFQLLAERTSSGRTVVSGDSTRLGQKGIFGFPSLFYVPSIQYEDLPPVDEYLGLILVHQAEYDYARQYGLTRFLSRLGKFCSSFPYPTWNTAARPSLFPSSTRELSILSDASHVLADYSYTHQLGSVLQLQLHKKDAVQVQQALAGLERDQVAVINTAFSPRCDASLYWQEGQELPGAYAAPEATTGMLGGSFVSLGFGQLAELSIEEDGFSVVFTEDTWNAFCQAIHNEESYETELPEGGRFVLDYVDTTATSKARPYEPVAVWRNLEQPDPNAATPEKNLLNVRAGAFKNLSGAASLAERVSQVELLAYIGRIEATLSDAMSEESDTFELELELKITPGQVNVLTLSNIDLNPEFEAFITGVVQKTKPCPVTSQILIRVPFHINQELDNDAR
jgi:hypothetical protein